MTNGILCTIDFSESSREALKWSVKMAEQLNCPLTILYTYRLFNKQNGEITQMKRKMEEDALANFKVLEKELLNDHKIQYDFKSEVGFIDDRIEEHARKNKISFLVIGKGIVVRNKESFDELMEQLRVPLVIVPKINSQAKPSSMS